MKPEEGCGSSPFLGGEEMGLFGRREKKERKADYDRENEVPVIRSSICTGEKVAGFRSSSDGHFRDVMLIRSAEDLDEFRSVYGISGTIPEEY